MCCFSLPSLRLFGDEFRADFARVRTYHDEPCSLAEIGMAQDLQQPTSDGVTLTWMEPPALLPASPPRDQLTDRYETRPFKTRCNDQPSSVSLASFCLALSLCSRSLRSRRPMASSLRRAGARRPQARPCHRTVCGVRMRMLASLLVRPPMALAPLSVRLSRACMATAEMFGRARASALPTYHRDGD